MNNLGVMNGTAWRLYFDQERVMRATNTSWSIEHKTRDITARECSNWSTQMEGMRSWSVDIEGFMIWNTKSGTPIEQGTTTQIINDYILNQEKVFLLLSPDGQGSPTNFTPQMYYGLGFIKSVSIETANEDNVSYSISVEGKGAIAQYSYVPFIAAQSVHP